METQTNETQQAAQAANTGEQNKVATVPTPPAASPAPDGDTEVTLELWAMSKAPSVQLLPTMVTAKNYDNGSKVISVGMGKRKDIATAFKLAGKENASQLEVVMRDLSDRIKIAGMAEMSALAASGEFTGKRFTVRQNKHGGRTATMVLQSAPPMALVTTESFADALRKMKPAERAAALKKLAEEAAKADAVNMEMNSIGELGDAKPKVDAPQNEPEPKAEPVIAPEDVKAPEDHQFTPEEIAQIEADEAELKRMEAEEAEKLAESNS